MLFGFCRVPLRAARVGGVPSPAHHGAVCRPDDGIAHEDSSPPPPPELTAQEPTEPPTQAPTEAPTEALTEAPTQPPTEVPTQPPTQPPTEAPTEPPTEPPTVPPTQPRDEYIGKLYTRRQLEAMDGRNNGYGPGASQNGSRPGNAVSLESQFGEKYDAHFIAPDNGLVYLTYSLGYEYHDLTSKILDTMAEKGVKGVFFINLHYAKSNPDIVRRMIDEGHIVGSHATNHYVMADLPIDKVVEEILCLHEYMKTTYGYEMTYFRPPSGYYSQRVLAIAQSLGYTTIEWSFAYADWDVNKQPGVDASRERLIGSAHSGAIYALHTVSETNAAILGDVIDGIRGKGYEFALLDIWR